MKSHGLSCGDLPSAFGNKQSSCPGFGDQLRAMIRAHEEAMSNQRFGPEFKNEPVRQIIDPSAYVNPEAFEKASFLGSAALIPADLQPSAATRKTRRSRASSARCRSNKMPSGDCDVVICPLRRCAARVTIIPLGYPLWSAAHESEPTISHNSYTTPRNETMPRHRAAQR